MWSFAHTASVFMTIAIAAERYVAIYHPLRYKENQQYRTRKYVSCVVVAALILNLTKFFEFEVGCRTLINTETNIRPTGMYMTVGYVVYNSVILNLILKGMVPITALVWIYTKICIKWKRSRFDQDKYSIRASARDSVARRPSSISIDTLRSTFTMQRKNKDERRQARMAQTFAGVVIMSLISTVPDVAIKIVDLYFIKTTPTPLECCDPPRWYLTFATVRNFLVALNSVINVVIYSLLDKRFRRECGEFFRSCKCRGNETRVQSATMSPMEGTNRFTYSPRRDSEDHS